MTWQEWCVGKNTIAAGRGGGRGRAELEADAVAQVGDEVEGCHSVIHSLSVLVHLLYARHCPEHQENSPCPHGVSILMLQSLAFVIAISPPCPCPGPLHCQPGRQMLDLPHLPPASTKKMYGFLLFPSSWTELQKLPAAALRQRGDLVLLQKRRMKTQGTQARRCHRDQRANEMVFLKVREQMESPSLMHKA